MINRRGALIRLFCSVLLAMFVVTYGGQAVYMTAKAQLAQALLLAAWERGSTTADPVKPWPWADTHPVALLEVPRLGIRQVVLDSHSGEAMAFGPGLVSLDDSHVLGGHRDSHLNFLKNVEAGDELVFTTPSQEKTRYHVKHLHVANSLVTPQYTPPQNSLTLITCYPFDIAGAGGFLRYVVTALPEVFTAN